jgi:uncharacterized SAM-binding protein YcdF (DUF218 family)
MAGTASIAYCAALKLADPGKLLGFSLVWAFFGLILWLLAFCGKRVAGIVGKTLFRPGAPRAITIAFLSFITATSLAFLGVILTPINLIGTIDPAFFALEGRRDSGAGPEYCVLLGGGIRLDGKPSTVLGSRIAEAARLLREDPDLVLVATGGKLDGLPRAEAEAMAETLTVRYGVQPGRIILESEARDTIENFARSRALIDRDAKTRKPDRDLRADPPRVAVITSGFHMNRALFLARDAGLRASRALRVRTPLLQAPNSVLREVGAYWKLSARLAGRLFLRR